MLALSVVSDELDRDFAAAARLARTAAIDRLELRILKTGRVPFCDASELTELEHVIAGEGLTITALSPGLFKHAGTHRDFLDEMSSRLPLTLDLARRLGVNKILTFSFAKGRAPNTPDQAESERIQAADWLQRAARMASHAGVELLIEPEPICRVDTGRHGAQVIHLAGLSSLALNYDPANVAWQTGADPSEEVPEVATLIRHLHLKDQTARSTPEAADYCMFGEGIVNYPAIFRALQSAGYAGEVSLEPHLAVMNEAVLREFATRVRTLWAGTTATQMAAA